MFMILATGCSNDTFEQGSVEAPDGETPNMREAAATTNENGLNEIDLTQTFRDDVLDYKWVGSGGPMNFPYYFVFAEDGNVKMYRKPLKDKGWELLKDFYVSKVKVFKDDIDLMKLSLEDVEAYDNNEGEISTIIDWKDLLNVDITQETEEGSCFVLYPEGSPIGVSSIFTPQICLSGANSRMTIKMLKSTFNLIKQ